MQHAEQVRVLNELLRQVENGVNVDAGQQLKNPTSSYVSPDLAAQEWETFFRQQPQLIGLSGDLPEPGSYLALEDFGTPVLATRGKDGVFRAFVNACRHRGTKLTEEQRGSANRFVCPFHGWTYNGRGELHAITQPQDFGEIDRGCFGLIELPACEKYGFLFVHPQHDGVLDVDDLLGDLAGELANWNVGNRRYLAQNVLDKPMNWKLANDTFGETYHFSRLHRETLNNIFHGDALCFDAYGPHHRFVFPSRSITKLRSKPEERWSTEGVTTVLYYLFPNIQITMSERQIVVFRIYPDGTNPGRSRTVVSHYFSEEALALIDEGSKTAIGASNVYDPAARDGNAIITPEAAMEIINSTLEQEDYKMGQSTQQNIASGQIDYLIFGRNEPALQHFHNSFRAALNMNPLESVS